MGPVEDEGKSTFRGEVTSSHPEIPGVRRWTPREQAFILSPKGEDQGEGATAIGATPASNRSQWSLGCPLSMA